jgi:hypothetical protein
VVLWKGFFRDDWVPRILFVFEMLVWALDFRSQGRRETLKAMLPPKKQEELTPMGWDDEEEIQSWKRSLEWWVGKCGFCAGKGLSGKLTNHSLRQCSRGGAAYIKSGLGECIHLEGFKAQAGCRTCGVPREFCRKWQKARNGEWHILPSKECRMERSYTIQLLGCSTAAMTCIEWSYWIPSSRKAMRST